jgi:hypothetical protein
MKNCLTLIMFLTFFSNKALASDIYIMGFEQPNSAEIAKLLKNLPAQSIYSAEGKSGSTRKTLVAKADSKESSENLKSTLQSFQDAIKGLCISQVELSLAFSASAHAWVVVNGDISASAKVIIKNTEEKCK